MHLSISHISIKPSAIEDLYYMPLAEIRFNLNEHKFFYLDYIDPFANIICDGNVSKAAVRFGNNKRSLINNISDKFDIEFGQAAAIYFKVLMRLNDHLRSSEQARKNFPTFRQLMHLADKHHLTDSCSFRFGFIKEDNGIEKHITAQSVRAVIEKIEHLASTGDADEAYTEVSVSNACKQYYGVRLLRNSGQNSPQKPWIIHKQCPPQRPASYYFGTLKDARDALPLGNDIQTEFSDSEFWD